MKGVAISSSFCTLIKQQKTGIFLKIIWNTAHFGSPHFKNPANLVHAKSSSFWVSPLPKSSSFSVSPFPESFNGVPRHPKRARFGKQRHAKWAGFQITIWFFSKTPQSSWTYLFDTWFRCWRMQPLPFKESFENKYLKPSNQLMFLIQYSMNASEIQSFSVQCTHINISWLVLDYYLPYLWGVGRLIATDRLKNEMLWLKRIYSACRTVWNFLCQDTIMFQKSF